MPKFTSAYFQSTLIDESSQTVFLSVAALGVQTWAALASPVLGSLLLFAENSNFIRKRLPTAISRLKFACCIVV